MVTYLHPADHYPARIINVDKDFAREIDFRDIKFPTYIRDQHYLSTLVFQVMKRRKNIQYVSKKILSKDM